VTIHPIEVESYRIMRSEIDLSAWPPGDRNVVERMIHATADPDYATSSVVGGDAVRSGVDALRRGAPIVVDAQMVKMGITDVRAECFLDVVAKPSPNPSVTRSALALRHGALLHPVGAIFVIGNAPTALFELLRLVEIGDVQPALVLGLPVGFVGAAESKEELRNSLIAERSISNVGRKGGSAVAAGAMNALVRLAAATD
jgi:precorrin-8X/cobalt-precorrin-8 methylmutase